MTIMSTSAGRVAYDSHGSGDPIILLPSGGHQHRDYDEIRKLLTSLANTAFDAGPRPDDAPYSPLATKDQG